MTKKDLKIPTSRKMEKRNSPKYLYTSLSTNFASFVTLLLIIKNYPPTTGYIILFLINILILTTATILNYTFIKYLGKTTETEEQIIRTEYRNQLKGSFSIAIVVTFLIGVKIFTSR